MVVSSIFQRQQSSIQSGGFANAKMSSLFQGFTEVGPLIVKNHAFLEKIFINLIVQLAITYYVLENYPVPTNKWPYIIGIFALLMVIIGTDLPYWAKAIVFAGFSYTFGRLLARYKEKYGEDAVKGGVAGALGVFGIMFLVGAVVPVLGNNFGLGMFIALLGLLIAKIINWFFVKSGSLKKILAGLGIGVFGLYIMYDTNNILKRADYYQGDYITASMDYYLDIINLFGNIMRSG